MHNVLAGAKAVVALAWQISLISFSQLEKIQSAYLANIQQRSGCGRRCGCGCGCRLFD